MTAAVSPTIEDLLQRMQEFRGRTVLQVQGQPPMALNAFVVSGLTSSSTMTPIQGFLAAAAKRAFERLRAFVSPSPLDQSAPEVSASLFKSPGARQQIEEIDRDLLDYAVQQGWLSRAPIHAEVTEGMGLGEPSAVPALGKTFMLSNAQGDYDNFMPKEGASGNERSCMRWFILLHESAHLEFETIQAPFAPTPGRLGKQCITALNDWVFEVVHQGRRQHRELFNECFADVYGAMMLLKATNFSDEAVATITQTHQNRLSDRQQIDQNRVEQGEHGGMSDHHCTDFALRRMITNTPSWRDLSAQEMRQAALRYASDGFLDFIEPTRLTPQGQSVGALLHQDFVHPTMTSDPHMYYLAHFSNVAISEFAGEGSKGWFDHRLKGHPAQSLMRKLWDEAGPSVMEALKLQPAWFRFDLEALLPTALRKIDSIVFNLVRPHLEGVHFQPALARVQKIYEQDNRLIVQGLSRATFEDGAEVSQWRASRTPAASSALKPLRKSV